MRVAVFGTQGFEREFMQQANDAYGHELLFLEPTLCERTAVLAQACPAVCVFVNDRLDRHVLQTLYAGGTRLVALRCAGFNNVDLAAAEALGLEVVRVPAYSPYAVAEHTVALMLTLNRKLHRSIARVREQNFSLNDLLGFDMRGKVVGVVGTGKIGAVVARILHGFGCTLLGCDRREEPSCRALGMRYVELDALARAADIISLHCPLTPQTRHMINSSLLAVAKPGVMLINTSRGGLIDTPAVIRALKSGRIGSIGLDVYEEESDLFFRDLSGEIIRDDVFARLLTFPNVIVTAHQAFFTREAVSEIAEVTLRNITDFEAHTIRNENRVTSALVHG
ncbi:MAG: 2-hydroxyacid dehydrogenase [Phycisphaerae bacterium]